MLQTFFTLRLRGKLGRSQFALLTLLVCCVPLLAHSPAPSGRANATRPADGKSGPTEESLTAPQQQTVEQLRKEIEQLRAEVERLRGLVETKGKEPTAPAAPQPAATTSTSTAQPSGAPDNVRIAVATKAQGGDLSGAGNLLRTDRITIGGYGDFQFRQSSINERADGGGTPTFQNTRLVLGIAAVLAEKQNIVFNSEIEYEFGSREIDIEQAYVEWRLRPEFAFRGGIFVPAIGRFNTYKPVHRAHRLSRCGHRRARKVQASSQGEADI